MSGGFGCQSVQTNLFFFVVACGVKDFRVFQVQHAVLAGAKLSQGSFHSLVLESDVLEFEPDSLVELIPHSTQNASSFFQVFVR